MHNANAISVVDAGQTKEQDLLARYLAGREPAAFEALVRRFGPVVRSVCRRMLRHPEDVQDAFQTTFLLLVRRADSLERPELLGNWLYGVACRTCQNMRRSASRRQTRERLSDTEMLAADQVETGADQAEMHSLLHEELHQLPDKYRAPLVMCDLLGKTHEETARSLAWPLGSLAKRLGRARALLRQRLEARGVALSVAALCTLIAEESKGAVPETLVSAASAAGGTTPAADMGAVVDAGVDAAATAGAAVVEAGTPAAAAEFSAGKVAAESLLWTARITPRFLVAATLSVAVAVAAGTAVLNVILPAPEPAAHQGRVVWAPLPAELDPFADGDPKDRSERLDRPAIIINPPPPHRGAEQQPKAEPKQAPPARPADRAVPMGERPVPLPKKKDGVGFDELFKTTHVAYGSGPPATLTANRITSRDGTSFSKSYFSRWDRGAPGSYIGTGELAIGSFAVLPSWTLAFSPDNRTLAVGASSGQIIVHALGQKELPRLHGGLANSPGSIAYTPDGGRLVAATSTQGVKFFADKTWDVAIPNLVHKIALTPDGQHMICLEGLIATRNLVVRLRDLNGKLAADWPEERTCHFALAPRGHVLATWDDKQSITLRELPTGKMIRTFTVPGSYGCGAFSPDGRLLACACSDHVIRLVDVFTGKEVQRLKGLDAFAFFIAFAPDGKYVVSGGMEPCVRAWDAASGELLATFEDNNWFFDGAFSPDGRTFAITGFDKVHIWQRVAQR